MLGALQEFTASDDHDVDFIIVSHCPTAELRRIWNGQVSDPLEQICIGNCSILSEVLKRFSRGSGPNADAKNFHFAFLTAFTDPDVFAGSGVGGFPIVLQAGPDGHVYKGHTVNAVWNPVKFVPGATTYEDENDLLTGEWSFRHDIIAPKRPGLCVLAAEVPQAKIGYVYAPMFEDDPDPVRLLDANEKWTKNQKEMHAVMRAALDAKIAQISGRTQSGL